MIPIVQSEVGPRMGTEERKEQKFVDCDSIR